MAFQKPKKPPQFADLVAILAQSRSVDPALYQTIQEIINRLDQFVGLTTLGFEGVRGATGPAGPIQPLDESFITAVSEPTLANHRRLIAGANISLNTSTPNQIAISSTGGAGSGGMEYLGDYVAGTYNDGDIVIGPDGIAYVCTVNGTTTPPEPWPGVGLAINATVDATYWVVSAHAQLTNERVLSALANGYVKSTGGEPSTVAIIPVAEGGTGASTPSTARTNLGVGNVGTLNINGNPATYLDGSGNWSTPTVAGGTGVPAGALILFTIPCPLGYTRIAGWDGYYARMGPTHTAGGSATHAHGPGTYASQNHTHLPGTFVSQDHIHAAGSYSADSHSHSAGSLDVDSHNHGNVSVSISIGGTTGSNGSHSHTFGGETATSGSLMNVDAGSSGNMSRSNHTHSYDGTTSGVGDHSHSFSGSGSGSGSTANASPGVSGSTGSASAGITGSSAFAGGLAIGGISASGGATFLTGISDIGSNLPLYVDFYACRKD